MALFLSISDISLFSSSISPFLISNCLLLRSAEVFQPILLKNPCPVMAESPTVCLLPPPDVVTLSYLLSSASPASHASVLFDPLVPVGRHASPHYPLCI